MRSHIAAGMVVVVCLAVPAAAQQPVPAVVPAPAPAAQPALQPQAAPAPQPAAAGVAEGFVWAEACKACHGAIHEAWSKTKHARTIERLGTEERQKECVGCHVSGPKTAVMDGNKMVNANVQCEGCHGAGKAHVEAATAGGTAVKMTRKPDQKLCETCHSARSPHYRGFFYGALVNLVHKTK